MIALYYSKNDNKSKQIIQALTKYPTQGIHWISIDDRFQNKNGVVCVRLQTGAILPLPTELKGVPALLISKKNYAPQILYGRDIIGFFQPQQQQAVQQATQQNMEPQFDSIEPVSLSGGICSDHFCSLAEGYGAVDLKSMRASNTHNYQEYNTQDNGSLGLLQQPINMKGEPDLTAIENQKRQQYYQTPPQNNYQQQQQSSQYQMPQIPQTSSSYNYGDMLPQTNTNKNQELPAHLQPIDATKLRDSSRNIDSEMSRFQQERDNQTKYIQNNQKRVM